MGSQAGPSNLWSDCTNYSRPLFSKECDPPHRAPPERVCLHFLKPSPELLMRSPEEPEKALCGVTWRPSLGSLPGDHFPGEFTLRHSPPGSPVAGCPTLSCGRCAQASDVPGTTAFISKYQWAKHFVWGGGKCSYKKVSFLAKGCHSLWSGPVACCCPQSADQLPHVLLEYSQASGLRFSYWARFLPRLKNSSVYSIPPPLPPFFSLLNLQI